MNLSLITSLSLRLHLRNRAFQQFVVSCLLCFHTPSSHNHVCLDDGRMKSAEREDVLAKFKKNPSLKVMLISLMSGNVCVRGLKHE